MTATWMSTRSELAAMNMWMMGSMPFLCTHPNRPHFEHVSAVYLPSSDVRPVPIDSTRNRPQLSSGALRRCFFLAMYSSVIIVIATIVWHKVKASFVYNGKLITFAS